eukprot:11114130-Ditylum_brightwellii.AAC.1
MKSFASIVYEVHTFQSAIRALLQMDPVARPRMEDVMSQAKILGYEHEKPPKKQGRPKSSQLNP